MMFRKALTTKIINIAFKLPFALAQNLIAKKCALSWLLSTLKACIMHFRISAFRT